MGQYEKHVFVCTGGKVCPTQDSDAVLGALKKRVFDAGLRDEIRINKAGCFGQCGWGPMVVVYPDNVWYAGVRESDVDDIFAHVTGGEPVDRIRYAPSEPGVRICPKGSEPIAPRRDPESTS